MTEILAGVRRIVVHAGLAHVDDIMACSLAYAFGVPHDAVIERRNPTAEELKDVHTLVLDVGGVHDPAHLDFDHHQRARTEPPKCAFKLLGEWLGVDAELATLFPWYIAWNLVDVCGPFAVARSLGVAADALAGFIANPLGDWVIRRFADDPTLRRKIPLALANGIDLTRRCWRAMGAKIVRREIVGLPVLDMTKCLTEEISRCSEAFIRQEKPACIITGDTRGTGLTVLRCTDDPRLDFAQCVGKPYTLFAHPGGFILKTRTRDVSLNQVLTDALVRT